MISRSSTIRLYTTILLLSAGVLGLLTAARFSGPESNEFLNSLKDKLDLFQENFPEDRVYLQFDKAFFEPGDDVWFSAYIRQGANFKPSEKSGILHVELEDPKGNTLKKYKLVALNGRVRGDFKLDETAPGGMYKVKAYTQWQKNEEKPFYFQKALQVQESVLPNLKMKLDFERKAYGPGEEVSAKVELNTNENEPLAGYQFNMVASLNGAEYIKQTVETSPKGKALVKFKLPKTLTSNDGLVNILINYEGLTESISRSIPINLNDIKFTLYPEGGDLVDGLKSKVAFRALNEFGKPADISGKVIENESGKEITDFTSFYHGMGHFDITPEPGKSYRIELTQPQGVDQKFHVPAPLSNGFVLSVINSVEGDLILDIGSKISDEVGLVVTIRDDMVWKEAFKIEPGTNRKIIPTDQFPIGTARITLFDSKGIERSERMAFVNRDRQLKIEVETDKEKYLPREKVTASVKVTDERGMPMPGSFSMAVVDDQLLSFADDRSGNILSKMLIEYDLKRKVEEPNFYFRRKEPKSWKGLDYLMMTAGWRRFTWEKVVAEEYPTVKFAAEAATVPVSITDIQNGNVIPNARIFLNGNANPINVPANGIVNLNNIDLSQAGNVIRVEADNYAPVELPIQNYGMNMNFAMYNSGFNFHAPASNLEGFKVLEAAEPMMDDIAIADDAPMRFFAKDVAPLQKGKIKREVLKKEKERKAAPAKAIKNDRMRDQRIPLEQPIIVERDNDGIEALEQDKMNFDLKEEALEDWDEEEMWGDMNQNELQARVFNKNQLDPFQQPQEQFYRAREFEAPDYSEDKGAEPAQEMRNDFRSTVYWNGKVEVDKSGVAKVEFYNNDEISSFRVTVEGIAQDGMIGRTEKTFYTQTPFSLATRIPIEVATGDVLNIPVSLKNNTEKVINGAFSVNAPVAFSSMGSFSARQSIQPGENKVVYLAYKVLHQPGEGVLEVAFENQGFSDAVSESIKIVPKGFPVGLSFSDKALNAEYDFAIHHSVEGSIQAKVTVFPTVMSDLLTGIEGILREPGGCFEQTSRTSYPNVMVMRYLIEQDEIDPDLRETAMSMLKRGYKRLTSFETSSKGYEWFGSSPGHEALTAYGLMQFNEMKTVLPEVDQLMIDRTANWLMKRRDGKGKFQRSSNTADSFGRADDQITNAYICYALSQAGYKGIDKEIELSYTLAKESKDPYQLALMASVMMTTGNQGAGKKLLTSLLSQQAKDGSFNGKVHSITRSTGKSLQIETTALAILAMLNSGSPDQKSLSAAVEYLVSARDGHGAFSTTQGTILALKALTAYATWSKRTPEDGILHVFVDNKKVATRHYLAGDRDAILIDDLAKHLPEGKHTIRIEFEGATTPLPHAVAVDYFTSVPESSPECSVKLTTKLATTKVKMGETVRLSASLENITEEGLPSTMAIIGIPAGCSVQPWQLKEMTKKKVFDFYEITGNKLICYYRQMKPGETRHINLDLKADVPGTYEAPAACGYLYYTNEFKQWAGLPTVEITK